MNTIEGFFQASNASGFALLRTELNIVLQSTLLSYIALFPMLLYCALPYPTELHFTALLSDSCQPANSPLKLRQPDQPPQQVGGRAALELIYLALYLTRGWRLSLKCIE